jgi:hypothetical protein
VTLPDAARVQTSRKPLPHFDYASQRPLRFFSLGGRGFSPGVKAAFLTGFSPCFIGGATSQLQVNSNRFQNSNSRATLKRLATD